MLRLCLRVIALVAIVTCSSMTAQAADTTLTLACEGTTTTRIGEGPPKQETGMNESGDGVSGSIDRVTGDLEANSVVGNWTISYSLKCKPTQRMF
jgi:hypothetical protein